MISGIDFFSNADSATRTRVGSGSSPPRPSNICENTGTMNSNMAVIEMIANPNTTRGYVMADLIVDRNFTSDSKLSANCISTWSRKPPVSPARVMLTMMGGNTLGCCASACESEDPCSTANRTDA